MPKSIDSSKIESKDAAVSKLQAAASEDIRRVELLVRDVKRQVGRPIFYTSETIPEPTAENRLTVVDNGADPSALYITANGKRYKLALTEE